MGFFTRFILKYGPGSPGRTAKVTCKKIKHISAPDYRLHWPEYMMKLAKIRHQATLANPLGYDDERTYFNAITDERWQELISQTNGSLTAFIFVMMYFETKVFRKAVSGYEIPNTVQEENRKLILAAIYDVVSKTPFNNSISLSETEKIIQNIGGYYYFNISTRISENA